MKNEILLQQAIELLQAAKPDELETVQINHTNYDDGSVGFTVDLTYPAKDVEETNKCEDGTERVIV